MHQKEFVICIFFFWINRTFGLIFLKMHDVVSRKRKFLIQTPFILENWDGDGGFTLNFRRNGVITYSNLPPQGD